MQSVRRLNATASRVRSLRSADHFTVNGTLLEAWASHKSYRPRGGGRNRDTDFTGERRRRETHVSTTDPEARLYRTGKQQGAQLCYLGRARNKLWFELTAAYNLTRLAQLEAAPWPSAGKPTDETTQPPIKRHPRTDCERCPSRSRPSISFDPPRSATSSAPC